MTTEPVAGETPEVRRSKIAPFFALNTPRKWYARRRAVPKTVGIGTRQIGAGRGGFVIGALSDRHCSERYTAFARYTLTQYPAENYIHISLFKPIGVDLNAAFGPGVATNSA